MMIYYVRLIYVLCPQIDARRIDNYIMMYLLILLRYGIIVWAVVLYIYCRIGREIFHFHWMVLGL